MIGLGHQLQGWNQQLGWMIFLKFLTPYEETPTYSIQGELIMAGWAKWLWGGMGWAMFGPIGGIMGYTLGSMSENTRGFHSNYQGFSGNVPTSGGDFGSALLILFAVVMKADS